jgi:16S rRNA (uracil1498-N3)-methyltransferase
MVGPEGGLTKDEVAAATEAGFIPVTLGSRILRTETAGIALLAVLQFFWGDMG